MDSDPPLSRASRRDFIIAFLAGKTGSARVAPPPGWPFSLRYQLTQTPEEPSNMSISRPFGAKVTPCPSARALARPTSSNG